MGLQCGCKPTGAGGAGAKGTLRESLNTSLFKQVLPEDFG